MGLAESLGTGLGKLSDELMPCRSNIMRESLESKSKGPFLYLKTYRRNANSLATT